jgi:N-acetyl-anhydromuramyl-L-alanine amidase AmpD
MAITQVGCAPRNFRKGRPSHLRVEAVVIHIIDGPIHAADNVFLNNELTDPRSAHFAVSRAGEVRLYVDEADTAFHAGRIVGPTWVGLKRAADGTFINPNFYTIGIEHEGRADDDWPDAMYNATAALLKDIADRHPQLRPLTRANVVMHREIRSNKSCPGHVADLTRLLALTGDTPPPALHQLCTRSVVNVRSGSPSTKAPIVRTIPAGTVINVVREVQGESVNSVSRWFQNVDDDFVWGGALEDPT